MRCRVLTADFILFLVDLQHDGALIPTYFESFRSHLLTLPPQLQVTMMSRITIDLKKRAKGHIHYDLSRHPVVVDEDGPYCYQLSHIRFRDMITGRKSVPKNTRVPREPTWKHSSDSSDTTSDAGTILIIRGATADETLKQTRGPDGG